MAKNIVATDGGSVIATTPDGRLVQVNVDLGNCIVKLTPPDAGAALDDGYTFLGEAKALIELLQMGARATEGNADLLAKGLNGVCKLLELSNAAFVAADPQTDLRA